MNKTDQGCINIQKKDVKPKEKTTRIKRFQVLFPTDHLDTNRIKSDLNLKDLRNIIEKYDCRLEIKYYICPHMHLLTI